MRRERQGLAKAECRTCLFHWAQNFGVERVSARFAVSLKFAAQYRRTLDQSLLDVGIEILLVIPGNAAILPDMTTKWVEADVAVLGKQLLPVFWPLLVNVIRAFLSGNRRGKKNRGRRFHQAFYESY